MSNMANYKVVRKIGTGAFGNVYLLKSSGNKMKFALKTVDTSRLSGKEERSISEEGLLMLKLSHCHLVHCYDAFVCNRHLFLVLELCSHDSLDHFLRGRNSLLSDEQIYVWFSQMADVLRYLHALKVIHRDLKPANIFLDRDHQVKLGDLGVASELENTVQERQTVAGTLPYMSPEVLTGIPYNCKTDIWSLGCCIHEVMTLNKTFQGHSWMELHHLITSATIPSIPLSYNQDLRQLVMSLLNTNPSQRPDALEILHSLFQIRGRRFRSDSSPPPMNVEFDQHQIFMAVKTFEMSPGRDGIISLKTNVDVEDDVQSELSVPDCTGFNSIDYTDKSTDSSTSSYYQTSMKMSSSRDEPKLESRSQRPLPMPKSKKKQQILKSQQRKFSPPNIESETFVEDLTRGCHDWLRSRHLQNTTIKKDSSQEDKSNNDIDDDDDDDDEVPSGLVTLFTQAQAAVYIHQRDLNQDECSSNRPCTRAKHCSCSLSALDAAKNAVKVFSGEDTHLLKLLLIKILGLHDYVLYGPALLGQIDDRSKQGLNNE